MKSIILITIFSIIFVASLHSQANIGPLRTILEIEPVNTGMALGTGLLNLGDVNGDGFPDFAASAGAARKALIYFGGKNVLDDKSDATLRGGGKIVKGDLNGDKKLDLVVAGRETVFVYLGNGVTPIPWDTIPSFVLTDTTVNESFGLSFDVGDLNNDGFDDIAIGAYNYNQARGKINIYLGHDVISQTPTFMAVGDSALFSYGRTVKIGDINGDGIADLAIGSDSRMGSPRQAVSTIDIFFGGKNWIFTKNGFRQQFDSRLVGIDDIYLFNLIDVNYDGKLDLSFGYGEKTYFFFSKGDSISSTPNLILTNPDSTLYDFILGPAIDIGDINNDGVSDFVIRGGILAPGGCTILYLGSNTRPPVPVAGRCKGFANTNNVFELAIPVGDINGDGVNDFASSVPFAAISPSDGYVVIFSGDATLTSIEENSKQPDEFQLSQNYPNPFNPQTTIEYSLQKPGYVLIIIYDSLGKEVIRLGEKEEERGLHKVQWDGRSLKGERMPSGVYYYSLKVNGAQSITKKLLLLK